jgi:hypothetical protein
VTRRPPTSQGKTRADAPDYHTWFASIGDGSPSFSIENDGSKLTCALLVRWQDLNDAKNSFLGYPLPQGDRGQQKWISRQLADAALVFESRSIERYGRSICRQTMVWRSLK